jgi:CheY-like chemotaxis protein
LARILLVDDDADVRIMLEHVLLHEGYEVDTAETVSGGKERVRSGSYDLALLDGKLPDGHGSEIAVAASAKGMKVLMVTGYAFTMPEKRARALRGSAETAATLRTCCGYREGASRLITLTSVLLITQRECLARITGRAYPGHGGC